MPSPFDPRNALYFGADHLEFCHDHAQLKFPFDPTGTDTDNSNSAYVPLKWGGGVREFTAVRSRSTPSYSAVYNFSFSFADKSVPAFALFYSDPRSTRPWRSKVVVYSSLFAVSRLDPSLWPGGLRRFLASNFRVVPGSLMRLDVCVDLSAPLPEVLAAFDKVPQFHSVIGKDKKHQGYAQTYYTDEVQNGLNRSRLVRVYDKMLDSFRKGKTWLFPHLADAPEVRRVELELRPEFCARLGRSPLDLVSDDELLRRVFNSSLADYSTHALKSVPLAKCRRYSTDLRRDFCALGRLPSRYLAQALGYVRKIREASGYPWLFELVFWRSPSWDWEASPFEVLRGLAYFVKDRWNVPSYKLSRFFRDLSDEFARG